MNTLFNRKHSMFHNTEITTVIATKMQHQYGCSYSMQVAKMSTFKLWPIFNKHTSLILTYK
uniref:Uncharacterized protein n=1 Tax=Anguilla anguilla TaxID=7936 RepID=A0A0E9T0M5_ANGAN